MSRLEESEGLAVLPLGVPLQFPPPHLRRESTSPARHSGSRPASERFDSGFALPARLIRESRRHKQKQPQRKRGIERPRAPRGGRRGRRAQRWSPRRAGRGPFFVVSPRECEKEREKREEEERVAAGKWKGADLKSRWSPKKAGARQKKRDESQETRANLAEDASAGVVEDAGAGLLAPRPGDHREPSLFLFVVAVKKKNKKKKMKKKNKNKNKNSSSSRKRKGR